MLPELGDPEKFTIVGDIHGNDGFATHLIREARRAGSDCILQLGDFGIWPGRYGEVYFNKVGKALKENDMTLLFVDGNHEWHDRLLEFPIDQTTGLRHLSERLYHIPRNHRWEWSGLKWMGLGGATSLDRASRTQGRDWWPEEQITTAEAYAAIESGPTDVILTHDCPVNVDIPGLSTNWNPAALAAANQHRSLLRSVVDAVTPALLFHGHFHTHHKAVTTHPAGPMSVWGLADEWSPGSYIHISQWELTSIVDLMRSTKDEIASKSIKLSGEMDSTDRVSYLSGLSREELEELGGVPE